MRHAIAVHPLLALAAVIRADEQPGAEADSLRGFFDATRRGMVPTLTYQATERLTDLTWQPVEEATVGRPGARPSAARFHSAVKPAATRRHRRSSSSMADDAFALHGPLVLYHYPAELAVPARTAALPPHHHLGTSLRSQAADPAVEAWLADDEPFVYVSFGSFLSVRGDVPARVVAALRAEGLRAAVATGSTPAADLGELPATWLVRDYLPQVRLLRQAGATVTHGGNNSVTEAVATGTPTLVLPFSPDRVAGAAAVEAAGMGPSLDRTRPRQLSCGSPCSRYSACQDRGSGRCGPRRRRWPPIPDPPARCTPSPVRPTA